MEKLATESYRGIDFIRLEHLSFEQRSGFLSWAKGRDLIIKIKINNEIVDNCVQYMHYSDWFDNYRLATTPQVESLPEGKEKVQLAVNS